MLPIHPTLTASNISFMGETVRQIINDATR